MDLRRLVSLFLVAVLVAMLPVSLAIGPVTAMERLAPAESCPHDLASHDHSQQPHEKRAAIAAALCHQHCAPALVPEAAAIDVTVADAPPEVWPTHPMTPWAPAIDLPPPRLRA